jgi:'Cold-shock' DNA-binding domain
MAGPSFSGRITSFCRQKGHGFVQPSDGSDPLFMHISEWVFFLEFKLDLSKTELILLLSSQIRVDVCVHVFFYVCQYTSSRFVDDVDNLSCGSWDRIMLQRMAAFRTKQLKRPPNVT